MLGTVRLIVARFLRALPALARERSSPSCTSSLWWSLFSIPQWPRTVSMALGASGFIEQRNRRRSVVVAPPALRSLSTLQTL